MLESHLNTKLVLSKDHFNPNIENYRNFPEYLSKVGKNNKIAMFCTGGIRCEKASIYLKRKGFKNVHQLKGGILNYLRKIDKKRQFMERGMLRF